MAENVKHKDLVREEFTRHAPGYADAPVIKDPVHLQKLLDEVKPDADLAGANPRRVDGKLYFTHRTAIVVARKLRPRA